MRSADWTKRARYADNEIGPKGAVALAGVLGQMTQLGSLILESTFMPCMTRPIGFSELTAVCLSVCATWASCVRTAR